MIQILFTLGMTDGKFGLSTEDIGIALLWQSLRFGARKELNGSMEMNASTEERFKIIQWVRGGGEPALIEHGIKPILEQYCILCHHAEAVGLPDFTPFRNIKRLAQSDQGATVSSLAPRVRHIHWLDTDFILMFVGPIFSLTSGSRIGAMRL
jgi:hypothetical protein